MHILSPALPSGVVLPFAGAALPSGYLWCDGSSISRTAYPGLFSAIGTAHGAADINSFNLPDYRGRFLRGVDGGAGRDPDRAGRTIMATGGATGDAVGTLQGQATRKNGLSLNDPGHAHYMGACQVSGLASGGGAAGNGTNPNSYATGGATTSITINNGDNETRPVNANVNFIIKV